jgi:hypothetical protein
MNETKKTLIFCAVGLVLAGTAWALYPRADTASLQTREGSLLFEGFTDPKAVTSLEIQKPSEQVQNVAQMLVIGKPERLALTQQPSGNWVVSSREDYPAGVMDRVAEAAAALADLRIIAVESENAAEAGDHERFGVIDPLGSNVDFATGGIGLRVTAKGGDKILADLIIGKAVEGQTDTHYVRKPIDDNVYTAKIKDYSRLTTRFDDWIETRVLDVNSSYDIRQVTIHDDTYALEQETVQRRHKIDLTYDNDKSQWHVNRLLKWDQKAKDYVPAELAPTEELNTQKLNDLTFGLSDLKVVDVRRKDADTAKSINRDTGEIQLSGLPDGRPVILSPGTGFYAISTKKFPLTMLCAGGELTFATKDGLEYWVRFGSPAGLAEAKDKGKSEKQDIAKKPDSKTDETKKKEETKKDDTADKTDDTQLNRYMFVTVRFNEALLDKPKLEQEPGELPKDVSPKKEGGEKKDAPPAEKPAEKSGEKSPETKEPSAKDAGEAGKKPEAKGPPAKSKTEAPRPEARKSSQQAGLPPVQFVNYQAEASKTAEPPKSKDKPADKEQATDQAPQKKAAEKKIDEKKLDEKKTEDKAPPAVDGKDDAKKKAEEETKKADDEKKRMEDERKRIQEDNDKKIKEYDESLAKGRKRAKELNDRFADWFYVVSEDSYKKLHLTRDDVVKKKEEKKEDDKSKPGTIDPKQFEGKLE